MMVCQECGNAAEPGVEFCGSCGALLEWSGQPVESAVAARQPTAEASRPAPTPVVSQPAYTGLYCSACGVRNPEGRVFCRSCGERLGGDVVVHTAKRGWWRRLRDRLSGRREHSAGDRPRGFISHDAATAGNGAGTPAGGAGMGGAGMGGAGMGGAGGQHSLGHRLHGGMSLRPGRSRLPRWLQPSRFAPLLIVAGIIGVGLGPARGWVTSHLFGLESKVSSDFHQRFVDIVPFRSEASSAAPGHGAKLAIDGVQQTYWLSGPHDGVHARLTIVFPNSEDIDRIGLLAGEPGGDYRFQARPETVKVSTAGQAPVMVSFDDTAGFQNIPVSLHGVTSITITVKKVYAGQKGQAVAVREIEFFNQV